jgi:hypothetical protein
LPPKQNYARYPFTGAVFIWEKYQIQADNITLHHVEVPGKQWYCKVKGKDHTAALDFINRIENDDTALYQECSNGKYKENQKQYASKGNKNGK